MGSSLRSHAVTAGYGSGPDKRFRVGALRHAPFRNRYLGGIDVLHWVSIVAPARAAQSTVGSTHSTPTGPTSGNRRLCCPPSVLSTNSDFERKALK